LWNEAPLNHPDSRLQPASLNPSIMPQRPQAGPPGDNLDETARGRFPAPAGTPATPNGPPLPRLDPGWPIPVLEEILQSMENPTDRRILLALKHLARGLDERRRGEADTDRAARLAHLAARAHLLIAQAGSRLAIADLKEALRQPGQHQTELIQAFREMGTAEDLPDLLAAHLRAGSRLKAQIREAVMAIHHRSDAHRLKRSCRALSAQQNAQLLRLLASTSGSGSKMAAGESP
ncbi:MAG: hypothetical protein ACE5ID_10240, partial [Acidobacteriota bacterium]